MSRGLLAPRSQHREEPTAFPGERTAEVKAAAGWPVGPGSSLLAALGCPQKPESQSQPATRPHPACCQAGWFWRDWRRSLSLPASETLRFFLSLPVILPFGVFSFGTPCGSVSPELGRGWGSSQADLLGVFRVQMGT